MNDSENGTPRTAAELLASDAPISRHLLALLEQLASGVIIPLTGLRRVRVSDLLIRERDVDPFAFSAFVAYPTATPDQWIPVVEVEDGIYWAFQEPHKIRAWQLTQPELMVTAAILPFPRDA